MKKLLNIIPYTLSALSMLAPIAAFGVPANPRLQPVTQPDGSVIMARLVGDEHGHYAMSEQGLPINRGVDGAFCYYRLDADGRVVLSELRVNPADKQTDDERRFVANTNGDELCKSLNTLMENQTSRRMKRGLPPQASGFPCTGSPRGLVLLIEYSDVAFSIPNAYDSFYRMLNEEGYSDYDGTGSAKDWFSFNSGGKFTPQFDVVGPITLNHPRSYYGANQNGDDIRPEMMIIEACTLIDDEVDFSLYDEDNDGYIDNVFAFYAGYGENLGVGAPEECVWPHSWDIAEATTVPYYFDGVRLNHYACTNEIDLSDTMDGIGTFVHEFSHVLGLPDLYATNYSNAFTPGSWSVLDEGPYNNNSRTPPCYSAFERLSLGWLEPLKIDRAANLKIPPIAENQAYYIPTEREEEYFILENRQQTGWDKYIPYHGMLVWHIDYNENIWRYNTVNDRKDHQYVDLIEADNLKNSSSREGDPFPGKNNITEFTDDTEPAMRSWAGIGCGMPLSDIYESNGYIYLKVLGGKNVVEAVEALQPTDVGIDSFTANWTAAADETYESILSVYTASTSENGHYVDGYENLNLGTGVTSAHVENLVPGGEYRYSVRMRDSSTLLESVASNEITVTLLPPTFDYLTPRALAATEKHENGFTANWEPLEGADAYTLTVVRKEVGEAEALECGFDGGLKNLPSSWSTNSKLTYAADGYCGVDVPSLRFNSEGHYLEMKAPEGDVRGLEFWMRGVGTSDETALEIRILVNGEWTILDQILVGNDAAGTNVKIEEEKIPYGAEAIRLMFHPNTKGSVAIDDVRLLYGGETNVITLPNHTALPAGAECKLAVNGLEHSTTYFYTVTAYSGGVASKASNEIVVTTTDDCGVETVCQVAASWKYDRTIGLLTIAGMQPGARIVATTPDAAITIAAIVGADGTASLMLPTGRIWIVNTSNSCFKLK